MSFATGTAPAPVSESNTLTVHDRCDGCGAQAKGVATKDGRSRLMFCGHHITRHAAALIAADWYVKMMDVN